MTREANRVKSECRFRSGASSIPPPSCYYALMHPTERNVCPSLVANSPELKQE